MTLELKPLESYTQPEGPVVLIILDGVGIGKNDDSNAVFKANTPFLDSLKSKENIYTELKAHGTAVGMPSDNDMGNSEVGHNALGAGRIFDQGSALVKKALETHSIYSNDTWKQGISNCLTQKSTLHLIGLLSDGNVHNHIDYQCDIIKQACNEGIKKIRLHILLDGRDVRGRSALTYLNTLNELIESLKEECDIKIASGGGRMITTMDRYNADWSIVERGWNAHVLGLGNEFKSAESAIKDAYQSDPSLNDQYIPPFVITQNNSPVGTIEDHDTVFFTNFRGDRGIEISMAFENDDFDKFDRKRKPSVFYAGMMQYDGDLKLPKHFLVEPPTIKNSVSEYLCHQQIKSFAISETQKYGHVTYFWNGNKSGYINKDLENYIEIPSDKIPFNEAPDMKAHEITNKTLELLKSKQFQFGRINFPNGDMVGHTGDLSATIQSLETTDSCTQKIVHEVLQQKGVVIVLADHGNADEMYTVKDGIKTEKTAHTLNPVPCAIIDSRKECPYILQKSIENPGLANIAATLCNLLGYEAPKNYETSLIQLKKSEKIIS
ncbi:2,3-bisphosphoglycerate-independent phosphoglycerate mutase [Candidatus Marinamargulisbacteria bacterium SCGC AG-343-D04]|nr:2,3-bisphosphoglycerate-independent phosphoglycerate mutase [Candidatus Marinamargulisbacteria bacterium SCGC AG-343-D04]